jgi:hypothetical protein
MEERSQEPRPLFTGGEEAGDTFSWSRWLLAMVTGLLGMGACILVEIAWVPELDRQLRYPLGWLAQYGGNLTTSCLLVGTLLGAALGAYGGHVASGGRGRFWVSLLAVLVTLTAVAVLVPWSLLATYVLLPVLFLPPMAAAWSQEFDATRAR